MTSSKWRTFTELTDGERFDILHAQNPPSLKVATQSLWRQTEDGWECARREDVNPDLEKDNHDAD
jgi:hypothetical protein